MTDDTKSNSHNPSANQDELIDAAREQAAGSDSGDATQHWPEIPGYEIMRELHRGGQGVVLQAIQRSTKRKVAIKILLHGALSSKKARSRFEREIELVAQLEHPNIIAIHDSGTTANDLQFYVMDYIRGVPLHEYVRSSGLSIKDALALFAKVCDAVQYAHQRGVIHRDLKPSNVLVDRTGEPKVLDFGLAKNLASPVETVVSISQEIVGTLPYMSPEQATSGSERIDTRTDVYSLGVMLYEVLTGHHPYPVTGNMGEVLRHISETQPSPPSRAWTADSGVGSRGPDGSVRGRCPIDNEVETIVLKAIAKKQDRRYQSAGELGRDLRHYLSGEAIDAKRDSVWYVLRISLLQRWRRISAAVVLLLGIVAVVAIIWVNERNKDVHQRDIDVEVRSMAYKGIIYTHTREWPTAQEWFEEALGLQEDDLLSLSNFAIMLKDQYFATNDATVKSELLLSCNQFCRRALNVEGVSPERRSQVLNVHAVAQYLSNRLTDAESSCREALDINETDFNCRSNLAKVLALQYRIDESEQAIDTAIEHVVAKNKENDAFSSGVWRTHIALKMHQGKISNAIETLDRALASNPGDERTWLVNAKAIVEAMGTRNPAEALYVARVAYETGDKMADPCAARVLAHAHLLHGDNESAVKFAKEAIARGDLPVFATAVEAVALARLGRTAEAAKALQSVKNNLPAKLKVNGYIVNADRGVLWIDKLDSLNTLISEAERLVIANDTNLTAQP